MTAINRPDGNLRWTPKGYQHDECPQALVGPVFTAQQVALSQLLVKVVRGLVAGARVNIVRCKDLKTEAECTVLCVIQGVKVIPVARMFDGEGTDEVRPIMPEGSEVEVMGRKTNG